ncbi:MAG TPA: carboxylesterase family protein, partial [Puia sp.]|nr:carboxylesterase family protein [Puia sp.]
MKKALFLLVLVTNINTPNAERSTPNEEGLTLRAVQIETGLINGFYNENTGVTAYKGIPFAAPPVGDLRWKAPQPAIPWKGVKPCLTFGPSPMQPKPVPFL